MFQSIAHFGRRCRLVCVGGFAAALVIMGMSGCASWNLRGEQFEDNNLSTAARQARPVSHDNEFWGFSNKARQIERDCGIANSGE